MNEVVQVTHRDFGTVYEGLTIPDSYFKPGEKVLSVGEGFSSFARDLLDQGVDIYAIDPVYNLPEDSLSEPLAKLSDSLATETARAQVFNRHYGTSSLSLSPRELLPPERIIAGSGDALPFPTGSFDKIISHRLFEHVDTSQVLPEFIRVMKQSGEVRYGGVMLHANPQSQQLLPGTWQYDSSFGNTYFSSAVGFPEAMDWCDQQGDLSMYVAMTEIPRRNEIKDGLGMYVAGTLIIRKDASVPTIHLGYQGERYRNYPHVGKLYEVGFNKKTNGDSIYYPMKELAN